MTDKIKKCIDFSTSKLPVSELETVHQFAEELRKITLLSFYTNDGTSVISKALFKKESQDVLVDFVHDYSLELDYADVDLKAFAKKNGEVMKRYTSDPFDKDFYSTLVGLEGNLNNDFYSILYTLRLNIEYLIKRIMLLITRSKGDV